MPLELPTCDRCHELIHDQGFVCDRCGRSLSRELELVARLAGEITVTTARLDRHGQSGRRADPNPPLPVNLAAARDHSDAVSTLLVWARHIHTERGDELPTARRVRCDHPSCAARRRGLIYGPTCAGEPLEHPLTVLATWLSEKSRVRWLRHRPEAAQAFDELLDACRMVIFAVDRPADRWFAGKCEVSGCDEPLTPVAGAKTVKCRLCGVEHDLETRKIDLLTKIEDILGHASWCATILTRLGVPTKPASVWKWSERGRLLEKGRDGRDRPLYRLGDVRGLSLEAAQESKMRTLRAAIRTAELAAKRARETDEKLRTVETLPNGDSAVMIASE